MRRAPGDPTADPTRSGRSSPRWLNWRRVAFTVAILTALSAALLGSGNPEVAAAQSSGLPPGPVGPCSGAKISAPATAFVGGAVSVAVTPTCPPDGAAAVAYWVLPPGGGGWKNLTPWIGASWTWSTAGLAPGRYLISAWVTDGAEVAPQAEAEAAVMLEPAPGVTPCAGASLGASSLTPTSGQMVTLTAHATCAGAARFAYWITTPGSPWWHNLTAWTGSSWSWNTAGVAPGPYEFSVWVTDGTLTSPQAVASVEINLEGGAGVSGPCTGVSASGSTAALGSGGGAVTVTAAATCPSSPTPAFAYWLLSPGHAWLNVTAWTGPSWTWTAKGLAPGTYWLSVWVTNGRQTYPQAEGMVQVVIDSPAPTPTCSGVSLTANPSVVATGQIALLSASATCPGGDPAVFAYWLQSPPAGAWTNVTAWTSGRWAWNTSNVTPGLYYLKVWVTNGVPNAAQDVATVEVSVTGAPVPTSACSGVSASLGAGGGVSGVPLAVSAVPTCPNGTTPIYAFWYARVPASGATPKWNMVGGWTLSPKATVSTLGWAPGTYSIVAWASDIPGVIQAQVSLAYTVTAPPPQSLVNPSSNYSPSFQSTCYALGFGSAACQQAEIGDLNMARSSEGLGALQWTAALYALPPAEQLFVLANEERVSRGLPAIPGMTAIANTNATAGAAANTDPSPFEISGVYEYTANWAEDYGPIGAVFDWMYNDGYGSGNIDCTSPSAPGCWGHRDGILLNTGSGDFAPPAGYTWVAGAGCAGSADWKFLDSCALEYALLPTLVPNYTFTWTQALTLGA